MTPEIEAVIKKRLKYDPQTGKFTYRTSVNYNARKGRRAGSVSAQGYIQINILGTPILAHRIAWFLTYGAWPTRKLDHRNTLRIDNRLSNLRLATDKENAWNSSLSRANTSGVKGVSWHKKTRRWRAHIQGQHLGLFDAFETAVAARTQAELSRFGAFSNLIK